MLVLGIAGSLRAGSHNARLLLVARRLVRPPARLELYTGLGDLPAYSEDRDAEQPPAAVRTLRAAITAADALLIATPEYNGSIPGVLKNAVDWASRPFPANALRDKPVAVVGASTGMFGAVWAQAELRKVLRIAGAEVIDGDVAVGHADLGVGDDVEARLGALLTALVTAHAGALG